MKAKVNQEYFKESRDWYFDRFEAAKLQSNRWFLGFVASTLVSLVLVATIISLLPLKTLVPLVVHQNLTTGEVWIDPPKTPYVPNNDAEVQANIVRYITSYMSYTAADINQRFNSVMLQSSKAVKKIYADEQSNNNTNSPINVLGEDGIRTVRIEDIVFIDKTDVHELRDFKTPSHNLAKVDLVTTTINHQGSKKIENWVATIGWNYLGMPSNQQDAWENWNGFTVNTFRIDPKNIG